MSKLKLTPDQEVANNAFLDFLVNDENFLVIQGSAGTGKSFLIKHLLETFHSKYSAYCLLLQQEPKNFDIKITATTNKAVTVVDDFIQGASVMRYSPDVCTIFSLLGLRVVNNYKTGKTTLEFNSKNTTPVISNAGTIPLVFIDEASFIGEDLQEIINSVLRDQYNAKIVYIGDKYQLAPVGQSYSVIDVLNCQKVSLTQVMRNDGNILKIGTQFRDSVESGKFQSIPFNNTDVIHVDGPEFQQRVEDSFKDPKWNPSKSKILAWTNIRVQDYNQHIRTAMNRPPMFEVGEVVITNEFIKGGNQQNSFTRSVDSEVTITLIHPAVGELYGVKGHMVEIDDTYVSFLPLDFKEARAAMKRFARLGEWRTYFEIKETWFDLRPVYASSVHKAQGSTYDTVFLDLADIGKNWNGTDVARLLYVGFTRAAKQVVCYGYLPDRYC